MKTALNATRPVAPLLAAILPALLYVIVAGAVAVPLSCTVGCQYLEQIQQSSPAQRYVAAERELAAFEQFLRTEAGLRAVQDPQIRAAVRQAKAEAALKLDQVHEQIDRGEEPDVSLIETAEASLRVLRQYLSTPETPPTPTP